jgi:hypothetical protein
VLLLRGNYHCSWTFLFYCNSSFLFGLCTSILPLGYCVVTETGCNWYLLDINIYSLSNKKMLGKVMGNSINLSTSID